ncbi:MAG: hypothetical protein WA863_11090 [Methyloceanibacter sp.]
MASSGPSDRKRAVTSCATRGWLAAQAACEDGAERFLAQRRPNVGCIGRESEAKRGRVRREDKLGPDLGKLSELQLLCVGPVEGIGAPDF